MSGQPTLMVLGAGVNQVPGIRRAVASGLRVLTVDWDLGNPGHRHGQASFEASTTDVESVLALARRESPDGIVTFASDAATGTVANVARTLGLPGADPEAVAVLSNKGAFRRLQHSLGLAAPRYTVGSSVDDLRDAWLPTAGPLIVKPVDSSGSRGVSLVQYSDRPAFERAVASALSHSRSGKACVEEFIPGEEVGGDALLVDGSIAYLQCTHKLRRGFVVTGHALPPSIRDRQQQAVAASVEALCRAAGHRDGVVNFDVIVDGDRATVIEMSPRTGGNGISALLEAVTGVSTVAAAIAFALERRPALPRSAPIAAHAGSVVLGARVSGPAPRPRSEQQIRDALPELIECVCEIPRSGEVIAWDHGGNSLGYCVFRCPPDRTYGEIADKARWAVGLGG
ncbi:MAG: ATP-grasp domain-containing protein [Steroidobacteraceae bacterium]